MINNINDSLIKRAIEGVKQGMGNFEGQHSENWECVESEGRYKLKDKPL